MLGRINKVKKKTYVLSTKKCDKFFFIDKWSEGFWKVLDLKMVEHKKSYSYWERGHGTPYTYPTVGGDAWIYVGLILKLQIKSDVTITFLFFSRNKHYM